MILFCVGIAAPAAAADPLTCDMTAYKSAPGVSAAIAGDTLTLTWEGDRQQEVRLLLSLVRGAPTIREVAVRRPWRRLGDGRVRPHAGIPHRLGHPPHEQSADPAARRAEGADHPGNP